MNKEKFVKSISIRCDESMIRMIEDLQQMLPLNVSSIMRLALITYYKEEQMKNGDLNDK